MPFNGSGVFSRLYNWQNDRDDGIDILADRHDAEDDNFADALNLTLLRDGSAVPTQNLPMGGMRLTGLGAAVDPEDAVTKQYVDSNLSVPTIGDFKTTVGNPGPEWLKRDGAVYDQADYPILAGMVGQSFAQITGFNALSSGTSASLNGMAYGAGLFVVVGGGGTIRTSPTGTVWTARTSGVTTSLNDVKFENGLFVAVGHAGVILSSPDGITWTARTSSTSENLFGVTFGAGTWVVCGGSGTIRVSVDAIFWAARSVSGFTDWLYSAAYGNGRFVLVGGGSGTSGAGKSVVSADGNTWNAFTSGSSLEHASITFGRGRFLATAGAAIYSSPNGVGWSSIPLVGSALRIATLGSSFLAVGTSGAFAYSPDGALWNIVPPLTGFWQAIGYNGTYALIAGSSGVLAQSSTGFDPGVRFQVPADDPINGYIKAL